MLNLVCLSTNSELEAALRETLTPLADRVHLRMASGKADDADTQEALQSADGVLCDSFPLALCSLAPQLRWVQFWSAGVDGQIYPEMFTGESGEVTVCTGSGIHAASCSEHILSLMLAFARGLPASFAAQQKKDWSARRQIADTLFELEGKTVGIVGAGVIGQAIGKRCQAFGMKTVGSRRNPDQPTPGIDVVLSHLQYHDLILSSDFIVLALPLTPGTRMMFGEDEIEILRKGTYLFNIGRGGLLDERWVLKALQNRWLAGAGLDVFVDEPLPPDSPFWELDNVIITPHVGGITPNYWIRFSRLVFAQTERLLQGELLENRVDKDLGY
ncbi:MAG: D-2-hydroxyacid dehydrogenase [Armatimonadaceae bacterium]